jgi:hypothetical protein
MITSTKFLVEAGGREVHVAGHIIAVGYQQLAENILGTAALVGGYRVFVRVVLLHRISKMVKVDAPCVGFIATHESGPLAVAHRATARIGEQIDVNVFGP